MFTVYIITASGCDKTVKRKSESEAQKRSANGDVEPCAFVHYSNVNIKDVSLIDALKSPLFMEYYKGQPWNQNHLRPCPILDNPDAIIGAVERSGAHSTEMLAPEDPKDLANKTRKVAQAWGKVADEMWANTDVEKHNNPSVMYAKEDLQKQGACDGNCACCHAHD